MLTRRIRAGSDDAGVVAIIVALTLSTVLVGFGALAVDLGSAYARKADLQGVAERLAMASAQGLPSISEALADLEDARARLCADDDLPGVCDAPAGWARDGDAANGEVRFYGDQGQSGMFADLAPPAGLFDTDFLVYSATQAVGVQVVLPPSHVEFGLAGSFGVEGTDVVRSATARIGTPLGLGVLPFALTQADLQRGEFCIRDPAVTGDPTPPPPQGSRRIALSPATTTVGGDAGPRVVRLTLAPAISYDRARLRFRSTSTTDALAATKVDGSVSSYDVTVPEGAAGTETYVWATGVLRFRRFVSQATLIVFRGGTPPGSTLCDQPAAQASANRGFVPLARSGSTGLTAFEANVRSGPQTKLYPSGDACAPDDLACSVGNTLLGPATQCAAGVFAAGTGCLSVDLTDSFGSRLAAGLLDAAGNTPGRLAGDCGQGMTRARNGDPVDGSHLVSGADDALLDHGTPDGLRTRILTSGQDAAADGWAGSISSRALRCPRMAVMPELAPNPVAGVGGQRIDRFVYVWIDDADQPVARGLNFVSGRLSSLHGYVVQPGLLPNEVAGSPVVGPYLGHDMPEQVILVHNLESPGN